MVLIHLWFGSTWPCVKGWVVHNLGVSPNFRPEASPVGVLQRR